MTCGLHEAQHGSDVEAGSVCKPMFCSSMMMPKIIVVAPTTAVPMSTGLAVALKVLPAPSPFSSSSLAFSKVGFEPEILFDFRADVRHGFDAAQFINGLGVVGHRAEAVHGDDDRRHGQEAEGHEAEGENRRGEHELSRHEREQGRVLREHIGREHQRDDHQPHPERAEIAGDEAGQNVQRRAALAGRGGDFAHVP